MYALAYSIVKNETDAADVLSEAIFRSYNKLGTLRNERVFKTWILKIVHNAAVDHIRKNHSIVPMEEETVIVEDDTVSIATKLTVQNAVNSLKQPYRTVITLFYYDDLTVEEIAKVTGTLAVTVKKQLSRGRNMLKDMLEEDYRDE